MAVNVNTEDVLSFCFVRNDEVLLLKFSNIDKSQELYNIRCPSLTASEENTSNLKRVGEHYFVTAGVSSCSTYIAASDSSNLLHIWKWDSYLWSHFFTHSLVRKSQKIIFTNAGNEVIVADRGGDVFVFPVSKQGGGKFLLGHISLIIDIAISENDKYLLTCDRDGKIRVSCYPNCYNIHCYCLGHQEFVSSVQCVQLSKELILTASGDGSVKLWDFDGENVSSVNMYENATICENLDKYGILNKLHTEDGQNQKAVLPGLIDEKQAMCAVKQIKYCSTKKLCAITFYSIKGIAIYNLLESKANFFEFIQFIPLECIPFDVIFDENGNIIILQKSTTKQYACFKLVNEKKLNFEPVESDGVFISESIQSFCGNVQNLKELQQDDYETLFKRNFENFEERNDDCVESKNKSSKKSKNSSVESK